MWLKRQQPVQLYQASELPYVILEDGVNLCYDNCYGTEIADTAEFNIQFYAPSNALQRINTYFYKFESLPITIPFTDVIKLDNTVVEGKIIKQAASSEGEPCKVVLMKSEYIRNESELEPISDILEDCDQAFILTGEHIDPQVRLFNDLAHIIPYCNWERTLVSVAHAVSSQKTRKYCWTRSVPEMNLSCYGIESTDELKDIYDASNSVGLSDVSIAWE